MKCLTFSGLVLSLFSCKGVEDLQENTFDKLVLKSNAFEHNGFIPEKYTGKGEDLSPELTINGISSSAKSIVIIMDDLDNIQFTRAFNHWIIWNIPIQEIIPEGIPSGKVVETLGGAIQGIGYGKHKYRGPNPPFFIRNPHRYKFNVYVLDCTLELDSNSKKKDLIKAIDTHIIQYGSIICLYKNK
jgi:Raf kinase inhibitor-like YbhB/YbcL family protein